MRVTTGSLIDHGKPDIFNIDQGSHFTSVAFTAVLKRAGVEISMDGRGRALDNIFVERLWRNVKYEDGYLNGYATMGDLHDGMTRYFAFYNRERPHQALNYLTPDTVYANTGACATFRTMTRFFRAGGGDIRS